MHASSEDNETHQNHAFCVKAPLARSLSISFPIMPLIGLCWRRNVCVHFLTTLFALRPHTHTAKGTSLMTHTLPWLTPTRGRIILATGLWKLLWTCCQKQLFWYMSIDINRTSPRASVVHFGRGKIVGMIKNSCSENSAVKSRFNDNIDNFIWAQ